jgi:hypothetical protein
MERVSVSSRPWKGDFFMTSGKKRGWIIFMSMAAIIAGTLCVQALNTQEADAIIRRAYNDYLGRDPDPDGLKTYRRLLIDQGWSEEHIRKEIRRSSEAKGEEKSVVIVKRAYRETLGRDPDAAGLKLYQRLVEEERWSEKDVCEALRESDEYQQNRVDIMIQRAYHDVLGREADPSGLKTYRKLIIKDHWSENDVRHALKKSPERRRDDR